MAHRAAASEAARYGVDAEEVAGEVLLKIVQRGLDGIGNPQAYVRRSAHNVAVSMGFRARTGRGRWGLECKAYQEYRRTCEILEQSLRRSLTFEEQDRIAAQVRRKFNDAIPDDFHRRNAPLRTISLDTPGANDICDESQASTAFAEGSIGDRVMRIALGHEGGHNLARVHRAALDAWDAIAERSGAPLASRMSLSPKEATAVRSKVRDAGGAAAVAEKTLAGGTDEATLSAFLAPFGELDENGERAIAATLRRYKDYADSLWSSAVGAATRPRHNNGGPPR